MYVCNRANRRISTSICLRRRIASVNKSGVFIKQIKEEVELHCCVDVTGNLKKCPRDGNQYEYLWAKVATPNKDYNVAFIYHPHHPHSYDYHCEINFIGFLVNSCESVLVSTPNTRLLEMSTNWT